MRKFLGLLFAVMIFASCASIKKTDYQMPIQVSLIKEIKSNNAFRMLWYDFITEANQYQSYKNYIPSDKLISHYSLVQEKKNVIVPLYLQVNDNFDFKQLKELGAEYSKTTNNTLSVRFPLKNLPSLLTLENVSYVEYNNKVELRLY